MLWFIHLWLIRWGFWPAMTHAEYMRSRRWRKLRRAALERDGWRCRVCNSDRSLQVHHRWYPRVLGTEPLDALTTLCSWCHELYSCPEKGRYAARAR